MESGLKSVSVCICTFKRPRLLVKLLERLAHQQTQGAFTFDIVVVDNDAAQSARSAVADFAARSETPVAYACEPRQNIALARNAAVERSDSMFIAFIDDDEFPLDDWLAVMLAACEKFDAAGMLGPVRPHFETAPPQWVIDGKFCDRPEYPTGRVMDWRESRSGNLFFRRSILSGAEGPFQPQFGAGGEDVDFFLRMSQQGAVFRWCNEAPVYETVPPERWTRSYMLKRALLRGKNVLKLPVKKHRLLLTSMAAAPCYLAIMPFALLRGQHVFMHYCIRFCDHAGRLLASIGLNPVSER